MTALAWSFGVSLGAAPVDSLDLDGVEVHPTRILARLNPTKKTLATAQISNLGLQARPLGVPGLLLLDESPATVSVGAKTPSASATGPAASAVIQDPAALLLRLKQRLSALRASGLYAYVEADPIQRTCALPSDSAFVDGTLWGLRNPSGFGADINVVPAWDLTEGSAAVIVGVIDTGIRYTHQDLAARMWRNSGESGDGRESNGRDDDGDGYIDNVFGINAITNSGDPFDDDGHGTHCAGTIGATPDNGHPHVGVARDVRLMALKFIGAGGSGATSDAIRCIDFAVAKGVRILSNSWGGQAYSQALFDSIAAAQNAGVLFVAAASNDASDNDWFEMYPANYALDNIVAVAALDARDQLANFSNYGANTVHLGAPGVGIYSCDSFSDSAYSIKSGTSMATPHVAGVAALVLARYPSINVHELRNRLLVTAPIPALAGRSITGGRVDAHAALNATVDGTLELQVVGASGNILLGDSTVTFTVIVSDLLGVTNATVTGRLGGGGVVTFTNDGVAPDLVAGDLRYTATFAVPATAGTLTLRMTASSPGKTTANRDFDYSVLLPPANDHIAEATPLAGYEERVTGYNYYATVESGEPQIWSDHAPYRSVWWRWTAPNSGNVDIDTYGTSFDTVLEVYLGDPGIGVNIVAKNDNGDDYTKQSKVQFYTEKGETYYISVHSRKVDAGVIRLNLSLDTPVNDDFADATALEGLSGTTTGSNFASSSERGEPAHGGGDNSVWWSWTAPVSGTASFNTFGSTFDTILAVYTGPTVDALSLLTLNDDDGDGVNSRVTFPVTAGMVYRVAVVGFQGRRGGIILAWSMLRVDAPVITASPSPRVVIHGEDAGFVAQAHNALIWRWQSSGDGLDWDDLTDDLYYSGTGTSALTVLAPAYPARVLYYRVRVTSPGGEDVSAAASLTVLDTLDRYMGAFFSPAELASPLISGPQADADGDGVANLLEYAFGTSPRENAEVLRPVLVVPAGGGLALSYPRRLDAAEITYRVEYSDSLNDSPWLTGSAYVEEVETVPLDATREWVTVRALPSNGPRHFLRLRVTNE